MRRAVTRRVAPAEATALRPASDIWGLDRGTPIEVHYIREFLRAHAADIRGRVLEVGDRRYTTELGRAVERSDVLNLRPGNPEATIVGDLSTGEGIPESAFDCLIVTNTLLLIYDVSAAVRGCYRALRPGGVLLAHFTGIARRAYDPRDPDWGPPGWHGAGDLWRFTSTAARRLCEEAFPPDRVEVTTYGSVRTATASLYGLAAEELAATELAAHDPRYELAIMVRAQRPA
jgi:SAM-dependent methyltransferase